MDASGQHPPKPPPAFLHIFKVLDHCGCLICATYFNNLPQNLEYYSACDNCCSKLSYSQYVEIYQICVDEIQRCPIKDLVHRRGWINRNEAAKLLQNLNISSNRSNAKLLTIRMELATPMVEKIEYLNDVVANANPS